MDKKLSLTILWHQHQPYYKNDIENIYHMPWVYMHAIKDYYEMARHIEVNNKVKVTFNYVPSLLLQLEEYQSTNVPDRFIQLLKRPTASLTEEEKNEIINQCFMANIDTMVKPLKHFYKLYELQASRNGDFSVYSTSDILDLEILYLLSWCSVFIRNEDEYIKTLLLKECSYTESEKLELLERLAFWVAEIIHIHKRLVDKNLIELTTTPFYHPITPLLININSAYESFHDVSIPHVENNLRSDAVIQLKEGLAKFESIFNFVPLGVWPAEGSISQESVELWCENGVRWIASDEDVLANSLKINLKDLKNRYRLYMRRFQVHDGKKINIFFRDKTLSDLIGFTYSNWKAEDAVANFIHHLREIYDSVNFSPTVSVILDGENAWEYYPNNAYDFFTLLYKRLAEEDWISTDLFQDVLNNHSIPEEILPTIQAGSWIMGNFKIWIGHAEKNKAWEYISKTKQIVDQHIHSVGEAEKKQIFKELHIAEGSDWFWWFGDDHFTLQADMFDKLFRTHLVNIHKLLKINVPSFLYNPIKESVRLGDIRKPSYFITPAIEGKTSSFFDWISAGEYDLKADAGSMHASGQLLDKLFYGFDENNLYLRFDIDLTKNIKDNLELIIEIVAATECYTYPLNISDKNISLDTGVIAVFNQISEIKIPITNIKKSVTDNIYVSFTIKSNGKVIEKAPLYNKVGIDITNRFIDDWMV